MDRYETDQDWAPEEMAASGRTTEARVLAEVPDLDANMEPPRSDGRMISQKLSTKLLLGAAVLLVAVAVTPFLLGKKGSDGGGQDLPAWHPGAPAPTADEAPAWNGTTAQTLQRQTPFGQPDGSAMSNPIPVPVTPDFRGPPQGPPRNTASQTLDQSAIPPTSNWNGAMSVPPPSPQTPAWDNPPPTPATPRQSAMSAWPQVSRSPSIGTPPYGTPPYQARTPEPSYRRSYQEPQSYTNQPMAITRPAATAMHGNGTAYPPNTGPAPQADYRQNYTADYPAYPQGGSISGSAPSQPSSKPGVARFEGTIAKPPIRTTHDSARSGVY